MKQLWHMIERYYPWLLLLLGVDCFCAVILWISEILGISVSAYKKVESGENQVSIASLSNLYKKMNVSTDYILFGKKKDVEETWQTILNCTEQDKLFLLLRLLAYFTKIKHGIFPLENEQAMEDKNILQLIRELQDYGE